MRDLRAGSSGSGAWSETGGTLSAKPDEVGSAERTRRHSRASRNLRLSSAWVSQARSACREASLPAGTVDRHPSPGRRQPPRWRYRHKDTLAPQSVSVDSRQREEEGRARAAAAARSGCECGVAGAIASSPAAATPNRAVAGAAPVPGLDRDSLTNAHQRSTRPRAQSGGRIQSSRRAQAGVDLAGQE